ncbi:endolytic transglycosylase MltG [Nocardioides salsibiostraticola]
MTDDGREAGSVDDPSRGEPLGEPVEAPAPSAALEDTLLETVPGNRRRRTRGPARRLAGCLPVLLVLAILGGLGYYGVMYGKNFLDDAFSEAADFPGPGSGEVAFEVTQGDSVAQIGRNLKDEGVVASVEAFTNAAAGNSASTGIQVGFYSLQEEMAADEALDVLVDPTNIVSNAVTIPEGLRVEDILDILGEQTEFNRKQFQKVLDNPGKLGLPDYADGNPEGYLFPSTYGFGPKETPTTMLQAMVKRWEQAASDADLEGAAERLGYTPHELMTIAAMVEAEGRGKDQPKVARVIYNRLENPENGVTNGLLQIDATVNYALGREPIARLTFDEIDSVSDSPYNTYKQPGLPPGPIEAPGEAAIKAASNPTEGDWLFYVTVNLETGLTKFAATNDEFLRYKAELQEYCDTQSDRC